SSSGQQDTKKSKTSKSSAASVATTAPDGCPKLPKGWKRPVKKSPGQVVPLVQPPAPKSLFPSFVNLENPLISYVQVKGVVNIIKEFFPHANYQPIAEDPETNEAENV